jgi:bacillithiol biosynthesis cysteine-adding enzyme BshC
LLVNTLRKHYEGHEPTDLQKQHIKLLSNSNCFTITTAHQPNIFTGPLYFIYKILHALKLCERLKAERPEHDFVPVYYMGSEDADLDELGHLYINGVKHIWKTDQTGAVGRMKVDKTLIELMDVIEGEVLVQPFGKAITDLIKSCYTLDTTIEQATFKLVNALFGAYGLIVVLPDDADYKRAFVPIIKKELTTQFSHTIVEATAARFPKQYKVQASGRALNLFYLKDNSRERLVRENSIYRVQNHPLNESGANLSFTESEILDELQQYPERFSPNVILRPLFQEMLLPNIAFIGGGGEVAYWMELKDVFSAVDIPFPVLVLRNSFLMVSQKDAQKLHGLGFEVIDLFKTESELMQVLVKQNSQVQLNLQKEKELIHDLYNSIRHTAGAVDKTLKLHTEALEKQALKKLDTLEKKMLKAEKKKFEAQQRQLHKLKEQLFPNNQLQERVDNMIPFYAKWGEAFIQNLYEHALGLEQSFTVLIEA